MSEQNFNTLLQKQDPDRRLAALFAPETVREPLFALYAFNQEVARIAESTSESLIGEMKLTWWRDAIADLYAAPANIRRHSVTEGLAPLTDRLEQDDLNALIISRLDDVIARPFASLDEILDYVDQTAGRLNRLALAVCEVELDPVWWRSAGRAWGLTGLLRAFAHRAAIGRAPVPGDRLAQAEGTFAMLAQGLGGERAATALGPVREAALAAMAEFKSLGPVPPEAVPALGYTCLAPRYFRLLPDNPFNPQAEPGLLGRQLRLNWLALTGR